MPDIAKTRAGGWKLSLYNCRPSVRVLSISRAYPRRLSAGGMMVKIGTDVVSAG